MTPQEVLDQFRREMGDEEAPYLISDEEALNYLRLAQDDLVKAIGGIADATTTALCTITLTADEPYTEISPYILRVRSGRLVTAARDVTFIQEADLSKVFTWSYGQQIGATLDDDDTGTVDYGILGIEENNIRWYKVPAESDTCKLHVLRLPYPRLTLTTVQDSTGTIEVPEDLHMNLVIGMRARAYLKQDSEVYDRGQAEAFDLRWTQIKAGAYKDVQRRRYRPRQVQYGGL